MSMCWRRQACVVGVSLSVLLPTFVAGAAAPKDRVRADAPNERAGERGTRRETAPSPMPIESGTDVRVAEAEEGCLEARILDYLDRHGDHGRIDPEVLLETNRRAYEEKQRERRNARLMGIGGTTWTTLGPTNGSGRITAIAPHPTVAGTAIAGAAGGGCWRTTDSGASWTALTDSIPNLSVGAVAYAPSNPNVIYVGTGEGGYAADFIPGFGLIVSADGGANWTFPGSVLANMFYRVSVRPTNSDELVVATDQGAKRSTTGQNGPWTQVITSASASGVTGYGDVVDLVRDPSNALTMYAATWDRGYWCQRFGCSNPYNFASPTVLKSTDGGATWAASATGLPVSSASQRIGRITLAIAPSSPQTLYAAFETYSSVTGVTDSHIYKTSNGGGSWSETNLSLSATSSIRAYMNGQGWYDNTLAVAASDPNTVLAGGVYYVKTIDGGVSWSRPDFTGGGGVHVDAHDMRVDAAGTLFIANDGGVWTTTDFGATATQRNANLVTRQFYALALDPANRNRAYGGQQDNGTIFRPSAGGTSWSSFSGSDGFQTVVNEGAQSVVYSTRQYGGIYRSTGASTSPIVAPDHSPRYGSGESTPFFSVLLADPSSPAVLYTASYRLWKSTTGGDAWTPLPTTTTDGSTWSASDTIRAIAVAKSNSQILMVSKGYPTSGGGVFRSTNGGSSWSRVVTGLPSKAVLNLEIHPSDPDTAFAALAGQSGTAVYYTTNGGLSWSARGTGLPAYSAQVVRFDPTDTSTLYCGTDVGVYRSTDGGANWSVFGTGIPAVSVYDLRALADGGILRAATHGRGVWELNISGYSNTAPTVTITTPATPQTISKGTTLNPSATFSDPDGGAVSAVWTFPDTWSSSTATSGSATSHTFNRAGKWPVTLTATDAAGAKGAAVLDVVVTEDGETCASPVVIPASGPFPYTVTLTTDGSSRQTSDPSPVGSCYPYQSSSGLWVSFTPSSSGTYTISLCGSQASAVVAGFTGDSCGPYTSNSVCLASYSTEGDCSLAGTATVALTDGVTTRFYVTNYFYADYGPVSLTIGNASLTASTPVIASVNPKFGSAAGGTPVVITGSGFTNGATVSLGGVAATSVNVISTSLITATTGAHSAGSVDAAVAAGSTGTLARAFVYEASSIAAPASCVATAASETQVNVSWSAVSGADHYEVYRRAAGGSYVLAGAPSVASYADTGRTSSTAYLYKVKAVASGGATSADSNVDVATTVVFTDDPLVAGSTIVKSAHLTELRTAVNAMRALAGLSTATFTDASPAGLAMKALHITELRSALDAARSSLALTAQSYANSIASGGTIRAADFTEIRSGTR